MSRTRTRNTLSFPPCPYKQVKVENLGSSNIVVAGVSVPAGGTTILAFAQSNWPSWGYDGIVGRYESMTDEHGVVDGYNPCNHVKEVFEYPEQSGATSTLHLVKGGVPYAVTYQSGGESASAAVRDYPNWSTSYPVIASTETLLAQAIGSIRPGEPPVGVDLLQFIAELTDFSDLVLHTARSLLNAALEMNKFIRRGLKSFPNREELPRAIWDDSMAILDRVKALMGMSLKDWAKLGSDWHLTMKLVYDPLIKDLKAIRKALYGIYRAYNRIKNPKPFRVRGRASTSVYASPITGGRTVAGHYVVSKRKRTKEVVAWAMIEQEPYMDEGASFFGLIPPFRFLWHYLGLYPRTSVLWEVTPLSFVFDMVIDIGTYLRQFESAPIQLRFKTIKSGYSVKSTDTHEDQLYWNFNGSSDLTGPAHVPGSTGTYTGSQYIRIPTSIDWDAGSIAPVQIGLPSFGQWGTIAELLFSAFGRR